MEKGRMIKRKSNIAIWMLILFLMMLICILHGFRKEETQILVLNRNEETDNVIFSVMIDGRNIHAYSEGNQVYLFLPSYVNSDILILDDTLEPIWIDGIRLNDKWQFNYDQSYLCQASDRGEILQFTLTIMKSDSVNTIFIETESGNMLNVWADKENKEPGMAFFYDEKGNKVYDGNLVYIKGRGNSTWAQDKKPYVIKLEESIFPFGMNDSKKWILLANSSEPSKITYKMALDMAKEIGLDSTSEARWTDIYLNGNYSGNYLICEPIEISQVDKNGQDIEKATERLNGLPDFAEHVETEHFKGFSVAVNPEDISGTYIIEKDTEWYYWQETSGFITEEGNYFSLKYPENASCEQVQYIMDIIQNVENLVTSADSLLFRYLDKDSLAKRYLLDGITGNGDMGVTSMYFYKKQYDDILYSGPVWDYDRALGFFDWVVYDPDREMSYYRKDEMITWLEYLENNEEFISYCREIYVNQIRPYIVDLIENGIDLYADIIESSYQMDSIVWADEKTYYDSFDANIRYIKFYLCERLNLFDEKFQVEEERMFFEGNGTSHLVTVIYGDTETKYYVNDGECFLQPWEVDYTVYLGWFDSDSWIRYNEKLPILEDMIIEALEI